MSNKERVQAMSKPFTKEEIAYYLAVPDYSVGVDEYDAVDSDRIERISSYAVLDMSNRSRLRTSRDFKNRAEYEFYKAAIYANALEEESKLR